MNSFEQYEDYDALGLAEILRKGEVTPTEVLEAAIDRSDKVNPDLNAIILDLHKMANRTISKGLPDESAHSSTVIFLDVLLEKCSVAKSIAFCFLVILYYSIITKKYQRLNCASL